MATGVSDEHGGPCGDGSNEVDCNEAVRQLYRYLDGELNDVRRVQISVHLDECGWCGEAAEFEAELRMVVANRCKDRVPEALKARVAAALRAEATRQDASLDGSAPGGSAPGGSSVGGSSVGGSDALG